MLLTLSLLLSIRACALLLFEDVHLKHPLKELPIGSVAVEKDPSDGWVAKVLNS